MGPRPMGQLQQMMTQVSHPNMRMQQLAAMSGPGRMPIPGHPAVTAGLRLAIPPQGATPGGTPTGSTLPSPALTPRSENDDMDTGSSRGPTPGSDMMDGPGTPDLGFMNDPNKLVKRRPSAQQKRRQSAGGKDASAKKRSRKGSRVDDGDYDNYIDTVMHQLKNLPPIPTVEPKLSHCFNACPLFGSGDLPKMFGKEMDMHQGSLEGAYGAGSLPTEGDYYSTMPFGVEPPVPHIPAVSVNQRGFYNQEFLPERKPDLGRLDGPLSPDLFYSSSPEPDFVPNKKKGVKEDAPKVVVKQEKKDGEEIVEKKCDDKPGEDKDMVIKKEPGEEEKAPASPDVSDPAWYDLAPDDSDEEQDKKDGPPVILSRPASPDCGIIQPIPIRPKPGQTITLRDLKVLDKENKQKNTDNDKELRRNEVREGLLALKGSLGVIPAPLKETSNTSQITLSIAGSGSNKSVLKALNGLSKLLKIDPPKQWIHESKKSSKAIYRVKCEDGKEAAPMDLQTILNSSSRVCRQCDMVIEHDMVKRKAAELPFLSKLEREESGEEVYFCDSNCYFHFAISRTGDKGETVSNMEQLVELQQKQKVEQEEEKGEEEEEAPSKWKGVRYKTWSQAVATQRKYRVMSDKDLTQMMFQMGITMMPPSGYADDTRQCLFCHMRGDAAADGPARLLNYEVDKWVHLNCALWSEEVYETVSGALVNVETALKNGVNAYCKICEKNYATIKCWKTRCVNVYHLNCAVKDRCTFYKNKSMYCYQHIPKGEKENELTTLAVYRRVFIERDENRQVANVMTDGMEHNVMRIGSVTFLSVGQLLPHQLHNFHTEDFIYPIGYKILRYYWSMTKVNKRCSYYCSVEENDNKPQFRVKVVEVGQEDKEFVDTSCHRVWMQIVKIIEELRKSHDCTKLFPAYVTGEDLFGFTEANIVKVLESLPGVESLTDYTFKYGRNPLLELPLAVNPTGCARSEPKMRTHVKRIHNFQRATGGTKGNLDRAAKDMVPTLIGLETIGPYSKNFVQSKSSQYRKMKQEWRQNVVLARSRIQGLGLYASRDLEKGQMIIEYIGEIIRSELTDIREKMYEKTNHGIYMFRLDDQRVVDATLSGGVARYINHSCDPNCVTETVEVDRDWHIIIFANKRINRGEELSYDYKFDFEDDNKIPCLCGAKNCRKWMN
jgi:histone-lysine N-methyltransferase MLL3